MSWTAVSEVVEIVYNVVDVIYSKTMVGKPLTRNQKQTKSFNFNLSLMSATTELLYLAMTLVNAGWNLYTSIEHVN